MIAMLVCLGLTAYCGGYAVLQSKKKNRGAALVLFALCLADVGFAVWQIWL